jgi:hypothetical protein
VENSEVVRLVADAQTQAKTYADVTARDIARHEVTRTLAEQKAAEDARAGRRNRNRALTLLVALGMGFITPTLCAAAGISIAYAFTVTIFPDAIITLYAWARKY